MKYYGWAVWSEWILIRNKGFTERFFVNTVKAASHIQIHIKKNKHMTSDDL